MNSSLINTLNLRIAHDIAEIIASKYEVGFTVYNMVGGSRVLFQSRSARINVYVLEDGIIVLRYFTNNGPFLVRIDMEEEEFEQILEDKIYSMFNSQEEPPKILGEQE